MCRGEGVEVGQPLCRRSGASWLWPVNLNAVTVPGLQGFFVSGAESVGLCWESGS